MEYVDRVRGKFAINIFPLILKGTEFRRRGRYHFVANPLLGSLLAERNTSEYIFQRVSFPLAIKSCLSLSWCVVTGYADPLVQKSRLESIESREIQGSICYFFFSFSSSLRRFIDRHSSCLIAEIFSQTRLLDGDFDLYSKRQEGIILPFLEKIIFHAWKKLHEIFEINRINLLQFFFI